MTRLEVEARTALNILKAMAESIRLMEERWPPLRRPIRAQRMLDEIKEKRAVAQQCLEDGFAEPETGAQP